MCNVAESGGDVMCTTPAMRNTAGMQDLLRLTFNVRKRGPNEFPESYSCHMKPRWSTCRKKRDWHARFNLPVENGRQRRHGARQLDPGHLDTTLATRNIAGMQVHGIQS